MYGDEGSEIRMTVGQKTFIAGLADCLIAFDYSSIQNCRRKVFNRGLYVCAGGLAILKINKNSTDL